METTDLRPLVEDVSESIDALEDAVSPLLASTLSEITSKLPLLDKAKLHVLTTYAIESVLFSALRLNGVDSKAHPVFRELTRVKQYFEKIHEAENGGPKRRENLTLDKAAASRFIKHALAGNHKYDRQLAEKQVKEKANAQLRLERAKEKANAHIRFDQIDEEVMVQDRLQKLSKKRKTGPETCPSSDSSSESELNSELELKSTQGRSPKKIDVEMASAVPIATNDRVDDVQQKPDRKEARKEIKRKAKKQKKKEEKKQKRQKTSQPPKSNGEALQASLEKSKGVQKQVPKPR